MDGKVPYVVSLYEPEDQRNHPVFRMLDRPIAFQRVFVDVAGSINAALMLSQAVYWSKRTKNGAGWFYKTAEEWQEETGLTRHEQDAARRLLRKHGWWQEELRKANGSPTVHYRIDAESFSQFLANGFATNRQNELTESGKSITETTTENTTDILPVPATRGKSSSRTGSTRSKGESAKKKQPTLSAEWRDLLIQIMVGHGDLNLITVQQWGMMKRTATQLQKAGIEPIEVTEWHENVWCKEWPGLQNGKIKPPTMTHLMQGVGAYRASKQEAGQEQDNDEGSLFSLVDEEE